MDYIIVCIMYCQYLFFDLFVSENFFRIVFFQKKIYELE